MRCGWPTFPGRVFVTDQGQSFREYENVAFEFGDPLIQVIRITSANLQTIWIKELQLKRCRPLKNALLCRHDIVGKWCPSCFDQRSRSTHEVSMNHRFPITSRSPDLSRVLRKFWTRFSSRGSFAGSAIPIGS